MSGRAVAWRMGLLLGLLLGQSVAGQQAEQDEQDDKQTHGQHAQHGQQGQQHAADAELEDKLVKHDAKCSSLEEKDCLVDSANSSTEPQDHRNYSIHRGKPLIPDETSDLGFQFVRSISLSGDDDGGSANVINVHAQALRNRVFGQTWCSASACPVTAALTLSNATGKHNARKFGQGESVVACLDCHFSAASVSVVDGEVACACASSTNMPKGLCVALCQWEGLECNCAAGCSTNELGSESIHSYNYQLTASSNLRDQLNYLHRLMVRIHNTVEYFNIAASLDVPSKTRLIRANVEKRFGKDRAKAVPVVPFGSNGYK